MAYKFSTNIPKKIQIFGLGETASIYYIYYFLFLLSSIIVLVYLFFVQINLHR